MFAAASGEAGKVVARVNYRQRVYRPDRDPPRRRVEVSNAVRTAGYVATANLRERRYKPLWGAWSDRRRRDATLDAVRWPPLGANHLPGQRVLYPAYSGGTQRSLA